MSIQPTLETNFPFLEMRVLFLSGAALLLLWGLFRIGTRVKFQQPVRAGFGQGNTL